MPLECETQRIVLPERSEAHDAVAALFAECDIANTQDFVNDQDVGIDGGGDGEGQAHRHAGVDARRPVDPAGRADRIMALGTRLAKDQWTPEQLRDPVKTHNPITLAQLMKLAPQFDWAATLSSIGLAAAKRVDVSTPSAVASAGKRIADVPLGTWKEYLTLSLH